MLTRKEWVLTGITLGIIGLFAVFYLATHTYIQVNEWTGLKGDAKDDEFYIAEQYLNRKGLAVIRQKTVESLTPEKLSTIDTVLITHSHKALDNHDQSVLVDWLNAGGQLVVMGAANYRINASAEQSSEEDNDDVNNGDNAFSLAANPEDFTALSENQYRNRQSLFTRLGLAVYYQHEYRTDVPKDTPILDAPASDTTASDMAASLCQSISSRDYDANPFSGWGGMANTADTTDTYLQSDETQLDGLLFKKRYAGDWYPCTDVTIAGKRFAVAEDEGWKAEILAGSSLRKIAAFPAKNTGYLLSHFTYGQGHVVVYHLDSDAFSNDTAYYSQSIFELHHAPFLHTLVNYPQSVDAVLWLTETPIPGPNPLLVKSVDIGFWVIIAAFWLLLAWLWKNSVRLGSLKTESKPSRMSLEAHLRSSGDFYYRNEGKSALLSYCYTRLHQRIAQVIPNAKALDHAQLTMILHEKTTLPRDKIAHVLKRQYAQTDAEFVELIHFIDLLRKRL
ncbi:hypothetical protein [Ostreibacterium oceani]|uniref:DUF4350 domain-containing protein n=1 Tax=Ostreibacterium oceani TaxID=2654998 RepID=A0A6N7EZF6_9GAMM|nr:hypothetical protein [Ostreibacterium oceani]MPV86940.1 hypothetical protein [Ostreibacterium oceani]